MKMRTGVDNMRRQTVFGGALVALGTASTGGLVACGGGGGGDGGSGGATAPAPASNPAMKLGAMLGTELRPRFSRPATNPWDAVPALVEHGIGWARVGVTTLSFPELRARDDWYNLPFQNGYWSSLEVAGATLQNCAAHGMRLHAMLYLSDQAAHAGQQFRPVAWAGLSEDAVAAKVEEHATTVASHYRSLGLAIEVFEIGNELDFGVCGWRLYDTVLATPGSDPLNDPTWMRDHLWTLGAPLLKAAIRGVLAVYPNAKILLHVSGFGFSRNNVAATGFFQAMVDLGVRFDIAGYSFPYMFGGPAIPQPYFAQAEFLDVLTRTSATFGKPVQIVEFSYPASPEGTALIPASAYPFTPEGQAAFVTDFAVAVRGKVEAIHYFYPDYYPGFNPSLPDLEGGGLFAAAGIPRPALGVFKAIAERRLLT